MIADLFKTPFSDPVARHSAGRLGMTLFLISLAVIFAATALCLIIVRVELSGRGQWPSDLPPLPWTMAISTLVLVMSSVTMHRTVTHARPGRPEGASRHTAFERSLAATTGLGIVFLLLQAVCWWSWLSVVRERWDGSDEYRLALTGFYVLTGLHGLHVIGGLVALAHTFARDRRGAYDDFERAERAHYCAMYWHFLGAIWLALYALLLIWG